MDHEPLSGLCFFNVNHSLSTMRAAVMMTSQYLSAIAAVAFWLVIAVIVTLEVLFGFMIRMWAGAFWWNSPLLIADAISWSILVGGGTPSNVRDIRRISDMLDLAVRAGPGRLGTLRLRPHGGTVSHCLPGVGADFRCVRAGV